ncbi:Mitochondrial substrate/solute carrier [Dillenia turbinata]|uniref:Mitochondrial substrate/solute carrier n=1 Tax=Dillenia turbinata TaxID=194707 RepID=A0AAN8UY82_9MAGN
MAETSSYKDYVAGLLAGLATVAIGHPFDTVKVKLQKHNTEAYGIKYRNGLHCTARVLKTEGVKGLYRGATSSFVGVAFESSLLFGIYSQMKQSLQKGNSQNSKPDLHVIVPSAAYGGGVISFVLCPSELVKVQGIFRGGYTTFLRESIGNAVFFSVYEYVKYYMHLQFKSSSSNYNNLIDVGTGILSGGLGGVAFWCTVLPLDVAKTVIQIASDRSSPRNPFHILNSIYKRTGFLGFYTGLGPTIVRAFPANAAAIVTWELAVKLLGIKRD